MSEKLQNSQNSSGGGNTEGGSTDRYIRVRTDYYKIVEKPMTDGSIAQLLIKWKYGTIKADHGRDLWRLKPHATPSTYVRYTYGAGIYGNYAGQSAKGRYFTVTRDLLHEISENCRFVDNGTESTELQDVSLSTEESQAPF